MVRSGDMSEHDVLRAATIVGAETGAKRIVVTVKHNSMLMARLVAVRTRAFPEIDR